MVHLIPGTGGTAELFSDYRFPFPFRALDFPRPRSPRMSMERYARQFAEHHGIEDGDTLVGVSLGGMLSCEISRNVAIRKLVLISSGTRRAHLNPVLRRLGFLGRHLPFGWLQTLPEPPVSPYRRRLFAMFRQVDPEFLKWACSTAPAWQGIEGHPDLVQIHGDRDPVFPFALQRDRIHHRLRGAAHLAVLERRQEVNELLSGLLQMDRPT